MKSLIMRIPFLAIVVVFGATCFDFGYDLPDPDQFPDPDVDAGAVDAGHGGGGGGGGDGGDGGGGGGGPACEEGPTDPSDSGPQIRLITLNVDRPLISITVGDVVTWTNTDTERHTATAGAPGAELPLASGGFESGELGTGAKWAYRFCSPRTVIWFCKTHPEQMNGYRIFVEE